MKSTQFRWKWWAAGAGAGLAAYAAAGFWLVPALIQDQLPPLAQSVLARRATLGEVQFNPFTLRLQAQDLRLTEADGAPLVSVEQLIFDLQWKSLLRRAWSLGEVRIVAPSVSAFVAPDGKFNLAELLNTVPHKAQAADAPLPRLIVERFTLERGRVELIDRQAAYANVFSAIDFSFTSFSTLPGQSTAYALSAESAQGGKLRASGQVSVNPLQGQGELALEDVALAPLSAYLKSTTLATITTGKLFATLPYRFSSVNGKLELSVSGARLALHDVALARQGVAEPFAALSRVELGEVHADLASRVLTLGEVRASGGQFRVSRDARGEIDLAQLMLSSPDAPAAPAPATPPMPWKLAVKQFSLDQLALSAVDATSTPSLTLAADRLQLKFELVAEQSAEGLKLNISQASFSLADLALSRGAKTPIKLAQLGFTEGALDLASRHASLGRLQARGGQLELTRDRRGQLKLLALLPKSRGTPSAPATAPNPPWSASVKEMDLAQFSANVEDQGTGIKVHVEQFAAKLDGASSDLAQAVRFHANMKLREGGQLSAQGSVVPAPLALQADLSVQQLALAPLQPLLASVLKLKLAAGSVQARGHISAAAGTAKYVGALEVTGLLLNEEDGERFAAWKSVGAATLSASLNPNLLDIPELRVVEPNAILIIEDDRSFNAARLLVAEPGAPASAPASPAPDAFAVNIHRVRVQDGKLDFTDLSLRPQFSAKIVELGGVINGLSSNREGRSQIELDGRVGEFGLARLRGELNPFATREQSEVKLVFKNVDMVAVSPYAMKFAGYKIAQGKISLDLRYQLRDSHLEGDNQIVIDQLTLGERVDSPDAFKWPLELAIAILKDEDGRIDLGLPVSGDLGDPQFSYGAIVAKALGNVLTKIVTAPFRALGHLLGVSGETLEAIDFDPGSERLLPPEREKLQHVARLLSKRAQLKLTLAGGYGEAADGAALRAREVRRAVARLAGIALEADAQPGPLDTGDATIRSALRELYGQRFGASALAQQKQAAQSDASTPTDAAQHQLPLWQRVGKVLQGEPQVADASAFYRQLLTQLNQHQPLAEDALSRLGRQRAAAIASALQEAGVDPSRLTLGATEPVDSAPDKSVALKLGLAAK